MCLQTDYYNRLRRAPRRCELQRLLQWLSARSILVHIRTKEVDCDLRVACFLHLFEAKCGRIDPRPMIEAGGSIPTSQLHGTANCIVSRTEYGIATSRAWVQIFKSKYLY